MAKLARPAFSPRALRLARQFREQTLQQLGDAVGSSRQYIQQLESSRKSPSDEMVEALASALDFQPSFFYLHAGPSLADNAIHFRNRRSTTQSARDTARAHCRLFVDLVSWLDHEVEMPRVSIPSASPDDPGAAAELCRSSWGLFVDAPVTNVVRAIESNGVVATRYTAPPKIDAFSCYAERPVIVRSDAKGSGSRARFDLAHELGHLVMHRGVGHGARDVEREADAFASAFLMPAQGFRRDCPAMNRLDWIALFKLKERWGASVAAVVRRAHDLGRMDAAAYRRANVHIRRHGWHRQEPHDFPVEEPEVVALAFDTLKNDGHRLDDIARALGWLPNTLFEIAGVTPPAGSDPARTTATRLRAPKS